MFNIVIIAITLLLGLIGYNFQNEDVQNVGIFLICISILYLIIALCSNLSYFSKQLLRFENIREYNKLLNIKKEQNKELLSEFKLYLSEIYPELEKEIFDKITIDTNINIATKYPEIKSSKLLTQLVGEIRSLSSSIYNLKCNIENECKRVRYYANGKWEVIKPIIPDDIKKIL